MRSRFFINYWVSGSFYFLILICALALFVPFLPLEDPLSFNPNTVMPPQPPSLSHWFGTDDLNRDIFSRTLYGARISLLVGLLSAFISIIIGSLYGLLSGYGAVWLDRVMMRGVDLLMAIPSIFIILTLQVLLSPSIITVIVVIGATSWMGVARLVRAEVLSLKERMFVTAAKARGVSPIRILFFYIFPLSLSPIIVAATLGVGYAILVESVLSFLGLGVQPPAASWGNMLHNSLSYMLDAPWMAIIPGLLITSTVLAFNFIGDGLRAMFNPKEHHVNH